MQLESRVALVTGAGSGLGRATAKHLVARGASVALVDLDADRLAKVASTLPPGRVCTVPLDVTDAGAAENAAGEIVDRLGSIHVNVNCAGIAPAAKVVSRGRPADLELFTKTLAVNLIGTFNINRVAIAAMLTNEPDDNGERGVVVNTASAAAFDGQMGQVAYSASKGGVVGMTLPLARDVAGKGIRVNCIAPGLFATSLVSGMPEDVQDRLVDMILEPKRMGRPEEFASLVEHIVANPYLNAECIRIDAGQRMLPR
ncbi:SDR family NAD(P)-dependent oxidoreductase [Streptomyces sp. PSKA54]|uniref:SDR family NAD(P)-dependent oxidoreductase n=1 Tax=Streptomyces himalayensis subsp. aureolus TaxID=2758039 RepID=A0A7W2HKG2_9ACTN|nr:SDR family NAD(P)-dependent oxidoreductase [Streptomyces himalayensis]MBA4867150.1 SDR family NAD(P)-dependent oxidoreductase [Streptomyces himalayensis subsp. aureolus]